MLNLAHNCRTLWHGQRGGMHRHAATFGGIKIKSIAPNSTTYLFPDLSILVAYGRGRNYHLFAAPDPNAKSPDATYRLIYEMARAQNLLNTGTKP